MKTIFLFAGTRPEIIKMAPLVRELRARAGPGRGVHFCFTGQHLEMALPFLRFFDIKPDSNLKLLASGQSLGQLTSRSAHQLDKFFDKHRGAATLVQGDTTTAFISALISFYHGVPVGHVEAGLRTSATHEPFPEEANRRLITRIATWHYAPTQTAYDALIDEKVPKAGILLSGNTGIDALAWGLAKKSRPVNRRLAALDGKPLVLVTVHRRENIGPPLENVVTALRALAGRFPEVRFILPVHRNPKVLEAVEAGLRGIANIILLDPLEYGDLVWVMKRAELILSDSGGIQEEATALKKPVLVLRNETERPEAIRYGTSILVGTVPADIVRNAVPFLTGRASVKLKGKANPYGDGHAARKIADHLIRSL